MPVSFHGTLSDGMARPPADGASRKRKRSSAAGVDDDATALPVSKYAAVFAKMCSAFERERGQLLAAARPRDRLSFFTDPGASSAKTSQVSGRDQLAQLQSTLDMFGLKRSKNQRWYIIVFLIF